jgi:predicted ribosome quality control (RQC) complex YloA/Tae2 family protein
VQYEGVSNAIRFDSLLLAATARSLDRRLSGRAVRGIWLDRAERVLLTRFSARVRKSPDTWLYWHLHPTSGDLLVSEDSREPAGAIVQVAPGTSLRGVRTIPDERILCFDFDAGDAAAGFVRTVIVELIGSRWNAYATGASDAIIALLQVRERGDAQLRPGAMYIPPSRVQRSGADAMPGLEEFRRALTVPSAPSEPGEDVRRILIRDVAYTSPMNATYIVAPIVMHGDADGIPAAFARYSDLRASDHGFVLQEGRGQPYPSALGAADAIPFDDVVAAFAHVFASTDVHAQPALVPGSVDASIAAVHERIRRIDERIERLSAESRDAAEQSRTMRRQADLLFAQLHRIERGAASAQLDDFEGGTVDVALDRSLSAKDNATRLHEQAKRREHAAERVPALIARASDERARLASLQQRLMDGSAATGEIEKWSREALRPATPGKDEGPSLPYRTYRTTGGLEVRAGRNSRANDALTFHHSSPDDIWLHARDYAGAHVVLRWRDRDANPPARDIEEAAIIAAVNSRGRTSGLVPVDWSRRKYVRKRRKAPAGQVVVERAKTVFVNPDGALEKKLRDDD